MFKFLTNSKNQIKRKVFIIKGYSKTEIEFESDRYYVNEYCSYFQQNAGGAYYKSEIVVLNEPSYKELDIFFGKQKIDFAIIIFIGHGATQDNNQIFQLNSKEIIKLGQFILNCDKQIIILESCRVIANEIQTVDLTDKIPKFAKGGIFRLPLTTQQSREIYDSHIKRCDVGIMICFACSLDGAAYNYIFSKTILQCAIDWHLDTSRHCAFLPIDELTRLIYFEIFTIAKAEYGVNQLPQTVNNMNFPFAVSKF